MDDAQTPLVIAHWKTYTPAIIPVTDEDGLEGDVIVGVFGPLTNVHNPEPTVGMFPANVVDVTLQRF